MIPVSNFLAHVFLGARIPQTNIPSVTEDRDGMELGKRNYAINRQKSFNDLAADARETLNLGYRKIGKSPSDVFSDDDWLAAGLGTLPRRGLFAIACNHGGLFSEYEISAGKWRMAHLHKSAMHAANPFGLECRRRAMLKASVRYLELACPEEKSSSEWHEAMDTAQRAYAACQVSETRHTQDGGKDLAA